MFAQQDSTWTAN